MQNNTKTNLNQEVESFLTNHYCLRYNIITGRTEYKKGETFMDLTDFHINSILRSLAINNIRCSPSKLRSLLCSNYVLRYDPIKEYLDKLPIYDGTTDYIQALASTVQTTDHDLWLKFFRMWLVAWMATMYDNTIVNHTVIVLSGAQGIGKSRWLSRLVPAELSAYSFAGTINPENKDTLIYLSECFLIILDEFENLNRNQLGSIKELITKEKIKIRRPYGYSAENLPRRASFVASVNRSEFLTDATGNRRFLCFEAKKINYQHEIPIDNVLAQALHLFKSGFRYWLDEKDIVEINSSNEKFRTISLEEEALITYFEPGNEGDPLLTTTEILNRLSSLAKLPVNNSSLKKLGEALRKHKFPRVKSGRYVYRLREIQQPLHVTSMISTKSVA
jgi:predicted P-loop ATPase